MSPFAVVDAPHLLGAWVAGAADLVALGITLLLAYETYALAHGWQPITWIVRNEEQRSRTHFVLVLCLLASMLLGHFLRF